MTARTGIASTAGVPSNPCAHGGSRSCSCWRAVEAFRRAFAARRRHRTRFVDWRALLAARALRRLCHRARRQDLLSRRHQRFCTDGTNACVSDHVDVYDPAQQMLVRRHAAAGRRPAPPSRGRAFGQHHLCARRLRRHHRRHAELRARRRHFSFDGTTWTGSPIDRSRAARRQHRRSTARSTSPAAGDSSPMRCPISTPMIPPPTAGPRCLRCRPRASTSPRACSTASSSPSAAGSMTETVVGAAKAYDPVAASWSILPNLPTPRGGLAANVLGTVCYAVGGEQSNRPDTGTFADNQGFELAVGEWRPFAPMTHRRHGLGFAALDGSLWTIGGGPSRGNSSPTWSTSSLPGHEGATPHRRRALGRGLQRCARARQSKRRADPPVLSARRTHPRLADVPWRSRAPGWNAGETDLTPAAVANSFAWLWETDQLDTFSDGATAIHRACMPRHCSSTQRRSSAARAGAR